MSRFKWIVALFICYTSLEALDPRALSYCPNPYINDTTWDAVAPHLLPTDHPAKEKLDEIFQSERVIFNLKELENAGFLHPKPRKWTHLIVTTHPKLEDYVVKTYIDAQRHHKNKPEYHYWMLRVNGAHAIRELIEQKGWTDIFKVPQKWVYPLPPEHDIPSGFHRKNFILVEEDMDLLSHAENLEMWKSHVVDKKLLDKVYTILETLGLSDCAKPDNIPFSRDGKLAFIDTQSYDQHPVNYKKMNHFLSKEMRKHWKTLTKSKKAIK